MSDGIAYIVGDYPSTTETFIEREIQGLRARGIRIDVVALNQLGVRGLSAGGISLRAPLPAFTELRRNGDAWNMWRAAGATLKAAAVAKKLRAGHIHAHFLGLPATVAYCVSRMTGVPYSLTAHARDIYVEKTPAVAVTSATFRTTCTRAGQAFLKMRYPGIEFELVRHGIESRNASRPDTREGELRLLGVGRLVEKKGFEYLVEACEVLQRRGVPFTCRIVGEGPCEDALRRKIAGLGLEGRVQLEPFCSHAEIEGHYANAHVLIVPSVVARDGDRDGVPNVMLEAMAGGLPVVATDAGAIGEALIDGATGIGVPQRDPVAIADAVIKLSTDADLRHKVTVVARSVIEAEFSPKKWLDKLRRLFNQPKNT